MSKTKSLHHIVFATKRREFTIPEAHKKELYAYLFGILRNMKCHLLRMNGIGDHIHMLVDIHPTVALAVMMRELKQSSSKWLSANPKFPLFDCWGEGYYAVSIGVDQIEVCKDYIIHQEQHHLNCQLLEEMEEMAESNGMGWYLNDWE